MSVTLLYNEYVVSYNVNVNLGTWPEQLNSLSPSTAGTRFLNIGTLSFKCHSTYSFNSFLLNKQQEQIYSCLIHSFIHFLGRYIVFHFSVGLLLKYMMLYFFFFFCCYLTLFHAMLQDNYNKFLVKDCDMNTVEFDSMHQ